MKLMVDIGNTSASFTCFQGETVTGRLSLPHGDEDSLAKISAFLPGRGIETFLSSVAPREEEKVRRLLKELGIAPHVFSLEETLPFIPARVDDPSEVGIDLLLDAFGTNEPSAILVDLGTCNKVIYKKDGCFEGVAISPGFRLSYQSIFQNAEKIPDSRVSSRLESVGKNTPDALSSGILLGGSLGLLALVDRLDPKHELPRFLTGGNATEAVSLFPGFAYDPDLLARGMKRLSESLS